MKIKVLEKIAIAASTVLVSCSQLPPTHHLPHEGNYLVNVSDSIKAKDRSFLPFHNSLKKSRIEVINQIRKREYIKRVVNRGRFDNYSRSFIKKRLDSIKKSLKDQDPLTTAKASVNFLWSYFSRDAGNGVYTLDKERGELITVKDPYGKPFTYESEKKDSKQSLDEFIKSGYPYKGDCDDFAMALVTAYEIMWDLAKENKDQEFWKRLGKGLQEYRVIGVGIEGHALNATIEYGHNFRSAIIKPLEPQCSMKKGGRCGTLLEEGFIEVDGKLYYLRKSLKDGKLDTDFKPVDRVFNATTSYVVK